MATTIKNQNPNTVLGKVTDGNGRPLANLKVAIYDVDMREWQPLADTLTDRQGKYELQWTHDQLSGRGLKEADIAKGITMMELNNSKNKLSELGLETHETTTVQ
jgi:5-hydroxyisourate hydrolase-like protein (transthyretin family)